MSENEILLIQDSSGAVKTAKSRNEYILHLALIAEDLEFLYEFGLFGGHRTLGGISIDFAVWTPFITGVELQGAWWHRNSAKERFRAALISSYFGKPPVYFLEEETEEVSSARSAVKRKLK